MKSLRDIFRPTTQPAPWIFALALLALVSLTVYIGVYFYQVNSTLSDATWGDACWYNQMAYNFTHGRPLQTSVYRLGAIPVPHNPFPYINSFSLHVNFTPYLFLWLYKFLPTVNGLFLIVILWNVSGFLGIGWLLARQIFSDKDRLISYALACAAFFGALPFAEVITSKGQFPLFAGPFILAAYYFCRRNNRLMFTVTAMLLCGVSEDIAMFMISFSAYFIIFEKHLRKTALWVGIGSALYVALVLWVIQPASYSDIMVANPSNVGALLNHRLSEHLHFFGFPVALYLIRLMVALAIIALLASFKKDSDWKKPIGLIIIAPASHWFGVLINGGGHHFIPILACTFLALLLIVANLEFRPVAAGRIAAAALICLALSVYVPVKRLPFHTDAKSIARMETNKSTLKEIAALPKAAGISYWTNMGIDAFITSRNNVWRFPHYFDSADYLVIQKDADRTFFKPKAEASGSIEAAINDGQFYSTDSEVAMDAEMVKRLERELVEVRASHVVVADTQHVLILKRKASAALPCPAFTIGLGWMKNIGF